jgi:hypothetical protein
MYFPVDTAALAKCPMEPLHMPQQVVLSREPLYSVLATSHFAENAWRRAAMAITVLSSAEMTIEVFPHCRGIVATIVGTFIRKNVFCSMAPILENEY